MTFAGSSQQMNGHVDEKQMMQMLMARWHLRFYSNFQDNYIG